MECDPVFRTRTILSFIQLLLKIGHLVVIQSIPPLCFPGKGQVVSLLTEHQPIIDRTFWGRIPQRNLRVILFEISSPDDRWSYSSSLLPCCIRAWLCWAAVMGPGGRSFNASTEVYSLGGFQFPGSDLSDVFWPNPRWFAFLEGLKVSKTEYREEPPGT